MKYKSEVGYVLYIATCFIIALQHCSGESCTTRGDVRLQNGANKFEGRVEVCGSRSNSNRALIWMTVCNAGWDVNEAMVVCRQLGFSGNLNPIPVLDGTFSDPSLQFIHIDYIIKRNFTCQGNERHLLLNCTYYNRSSNYCNDPDSRMKPAGVYCFGQINEETRYDDGEIRLSNCTTLNNASGRVEVCLDGLWGTVCDDGWTRNDANAVCRQLGYNHEKAIPIRRGAAYFGEGSGPIHLSNAQCKNSDTRLIDCNINKSGVNGCAHSDDAGVICMGSSNCSDGDVQLVGGENEREGRVEICYNGVWGKVCADYGWDEVDANIVCQRLGFNNSRALSTNDNRFGVGDGPIQLNSVNCTKEHLSRCVNFAFIGTDYRCDYTAGVICIDKFMTSTSAERVSIATVDDIVANMSHDSTYKSYDSTPTASNSTVVAILGAVGALIIMIAIAVITFVLIARLRSKVNSNHTQANENTAYGEISHHTISASKNGFGDIGMEENIAYGQVPCTSTDMTLLKNEAYGVFPTTGDYEDV